jgi:hypothetical protein
MELYVVCMKLQLKNKKLARLIFVGAIYIYICIEGHISCF